MGYKQNFKSPSMLKMLGDLNKDGKMSAYETKRQDAIEKSMNKSEGPAPTKQTTDGRYSEKNLKKATVNASRQLLEGLDSMSVYGMSDKDILEAAKVKGVYQEARSKAKQGVAKNSDSYEFDTKGTPLEQTKAGKAAADVAKVGLSAANAIMGGSKLGKQVSEMAATASARRKAKKAAKKASKK